LPDETDTCANSSPSRAQSETIPDVALAGLGMARLSNHRGLPCADDIALSGIDYEIFENHYRLFISRSYTFADYLTWTDDRTR